MYSIGEVAKACGVAPYQIKYMLLKGVLKEPRRLAGRRCFADRDLERVRRYLESRKPK
jgi:DNA-binding transcriptional MerR regulator